MDVDDEHCCVAHDYIRRFAFGTTKDELRAEKVAMEKVKRETKSYDMIAYARMDGKEKKFPYQVQKSSSMSTTRLEKRSVPSDVWV